MGTCTLLPGTKIKSNQISASSKLEIMKEQLVQQLETALRNENFSEALQVGSQLMSTYPKDPDTYLKIGNIYFEMDNWCKAIEHFEKALSISPNYAFAYFKLGEAHELRGDFQAALDNFQIAKKLEPSNRLFIGHYGRLLHEKGRKSGNINLTTEGKELMERLVDTGETEKVIREQLAIAYLSDVYANWRPHPEERDNVYATESAHLAHSRNQLAKAKPLLDDSNPSINKGITETETLLAELEKRKFCGYKIILKAPIVIGVLFLLFGNTFFGVFLLVMAGLYYASQFKPKYMENRIYFNQDYREPFIIRRINAMAREFEGISIFGTLTDIFFMRFVFKLVFGAISYLMVLVLLPYEIIKGFWVNYDLGQKVKAKTDRQPTYS